MTRIRSEGGWGAGQAAGGSGGSYPPGHRAVLRAAIPAVAGIALLAPFGKDVRFSPVLVWFLAAMNLAIVVGAIVEFVGARRRSRHPRSEEVGMERNPAGRVPEPVREPDRARPVPPPDRTATQPGQPPHPHPPPRPGGAVTPPRPSRRAPQRLDPQVLTRLGDPAPFV